MKTGIAIAAGALAVLALAGCSKEAGETEEERVSREMVAEYLEYFTGTFHGEKTDYSGTYVIKEDITFTPYDSPKDMTGAVDASVHGEATVTSWIESDNAEYAMDPVTAYCYYTLRHYYQDPDATFKISTLFTLYIGFYQYDPTSGLVTDASVRECGGLISNDDIFYLSTYYWSVVIPYTRQF